MRNLLHASGLFLLAALLLRAVGLEPFSVPTGSMAPTLLGRHKATHCPDCGCPVRIDWQGGDSHQGTEFCPNCGSTALAMEAVPVSDGDRVLVNKVAFDRRGPRRWEMAVFRLPMDSGRAYVKRVVGLPGESVQLRGGDVYIDHELARKTFAEARAMRLLVHDQKYQPPGGWGLRWEIEPPHAAVRLEGADLVLDSTSSPERYTWLTYRHGYPGEAKARPICDEYSYNSAHSGPLPQPVHDFLVDFRLDVHPGDGWLAIRLTDGGDDLLLELPIGELKDGAVLRDAHRTERIYRSAPTFALAGGRSYRIEAALVDRRVSLAVDGAEVMTAVDRPAATGRSEVVRPVRIGARGVDVRVRGLRLFRDVYYTEAGRHGLRSPVRLGADQYFVLGDNSAQSDDSRFWSDANGQPRPVPASVFLGKPFLGSVADRTRWLR